LAVHVCTDPVPIPKYDSKVTSISFRIPDLGQVIISPVFFELFKEYKEF